MGRRGGGRERVPICAFLSFPLPYRFHCLSVFVIFVLTPNSTSNPSLLTHPTHPKHPPPPHTLISVGFLSFGLGEPANLSFCTGAAFAGFGIGKLALYLRNPEWFESE
jgi:hypothetical protein